MKAPQRERHVPFTCPRCGSPAIKVVDTRDWQGGIRRKRRCEKGHLLVTREVAA